MMNSRTFKGAAFLLLLGLTQNVFAAESISVDFTEAMRDLNFNPATLDANGIDGAMGNGIPDAVEMALVSAVLAKPELDLSAVGGVKHGAVVTGYQQALDAAMQDQELLLGTWPSSPIVTSGYALLGLASFDMYNSMSAGFGAPLKGDYSAAIAMGEMLGASGDADGDGFSNLDEYLTFGSESVERYIAAALDPEITPDPTTLADAQSAAPAGPQRLNLGIVLYPGFEVLDVFGPLEMWAYVPEFNVILIAEEEGPVASAQGAATIATHSFETAPPLDIVMVPGGIGTRTQVHNETFLDYLREVDETTLYTTSVCTGSALLARAGILNGHRATTNKRAFYLAEEQDGDVDWVVEARWVESGKMFTSSGVSAGTDMALGLIAKTHGIDQARALAESLEYTWHEDADSDPFAQYVNRLAIDTKEGPGDFVSAEPAVGTTLDVSPRYLRLYFDKRPMADNSEIILLDANGDSLPLHGIHHMGANDLMISVSEPLTPGNYTVDWRAAFPGTDSPVAGSYHFSLETGR